MLYKNEDKVNFPNMRRSQMPNNSILLIDDDSLFREAVQMMLEAVGFDVVTAINGKEGVELFETHDVKMVITDILMPEKDGLEVIQELRRKKAIYQFSQFQVVLLI